METFKLAINVQLIPWLPTVEKQLANRSKINAIRITCPCELYPLTPHFYIVKLGCTGVYIIFLFLLQNIDCGYSLEPPHWGGANVYPQSMFWAKIRKKSHFFHMKLIFLQHEILLYIAWACLRNVIRSQFSFFHNAKILINPPQEAVVL